MSDNELLLAISNMMDSKLKAELAPIRNDIQDIKNDVENLKNRMQNIENRMQKMENRMQNIENKVQNMADELHQVKLCQENVILPRLNTIESCYTDTYKRYRDNADRMEAAFEDIALLKEVVADHSEKLQRLA